MNTTNVHARKKVNKAVHLVKFSHYRKWPLQYKANYKVTNTVLSNGSTKF